MGDQAPPSRNKRTLCAVSRWPAETRSSPAPEPSSSRCVAWEPGRGPSSTSTFFNHSLSVCAVQPILAAIEKTAVIARNIRLGDPKPFAPLGRGLPVKICSLSCSYRLHFLRVGASGKPGAVHNLTSFLPSSFAYDEEVRYKLFTARSKIL